MGKDGVGLPKTALSLPYGQRIFQVCDDLQILIHNGNRRCVVTGVDAYGTAFHFSPTARASCISALSTPFAKEYAFSSSYF